MAKSTPQVTAAPVNTAVQYGSAGAPEQTIVPIDPMVQLADELSSSFGGLSESIVNLGFAAQRYNAKQEQASFEYWQGLANKLNNNNESLAKLVEIGEAHPSENPYVMQGRSRAVGEAMAREWQQQTNGAIPELRMTNSAFADTEGALGWFGEESAAYFRSMPNAGGDLKAMEKAFNNSLAGYRQKFEADQRRYVGEKALEEARVGFTTGIQDLIRNGTGITSVEASQALDQPMMFLRSDRKGAEDAVKKAEELAKQELINAVTAAIDDDATAWGPSKWPLTYQAKTKMAVDALIELAVKDSRYTAMAIEVLKTAKTGPKNSRVALFSKYAEDELLEAQPAIDRNIAYNNRGGMTASQALSNVTVAVSDAVVSSVTRGLMNAGPAATEVRQNLVDASGGGPIFERIAAQATAAGYAVSNPYRNTDNGSWMVDIVSDDPELQPGQRKKTVNLDELESRATSQSRREEINILRRTMSEHEAVATVADQHGNITDSERQLFTSGLKINPQSSEQVRVLAAVNEGRELTEEEQVLYEHMRTSWVSNFDSTFRGLSLMSSSLRASVFENDNEARTLFTVAQSMANGDDPITVQQAAESIARFRGTPGYETLVKEGYSSIRSYFTATDSATAGPRDEELEPYNELSRIRLRDMTHARYVLDQSRGLDTTPEEALKAVVKEYKKDTITLGNELYTMDQAPPEADLPTYRALMDNKDPEKPGVILTALLDDRLGDLIDEDTRGDLLALRNRDLSIRYLRDAGDGRTLEILIDRVPGDIEPFSVADFLAAESGNLMSRFRETGAGDEEDNVFIGYRNPRTGGLTLPEGVRRPGDEPRVAFRTNSGQEDPDGLDGQTVEYMQKYMDLSGKNPQEMEAIFQRTKRELLTQMKSLITDLQRSRTGPKQGDLYDEALEALDEWGAGVGRSLAPYYVRQAVTPRNQFRMRGDD